MKTKSQGLIAALVLSLIVPLQAGAEAPLRTSDPAVFLAALRGPGDTLLSLPPETDPSTLLFNSGLPLLAPDGHQVTLGEWVGFTGTASVKCIQKGTHVKIELQGLIPNGLYDIFINGQNESGSLFGVLTSEASAPTVFTANREGNASINAILPSGPLSIRGTITDCLIDSDFFTFSVIYHADGMTYGPVPGPHETRAAQVFFDAF